MARRCCLLLLLLAPPLFAAGPPGEAELRAGLAGIAAGDEAALLAYARAVRAAGGDGERFAAAWLAARRPLDLLSNVLLEVFVPAAQVVPRRFPGGLAGTSSLSGGAYGAVGPN